MPRKSVLDTAVADFAEQWAKRDKADDSPERGFARSIVEDHRDALEETFGGLTPAQIVDYTERAREDGDEAAEWRANVWTLGALPKQSVVGG